MHKKIAKKVLPIALLSSLAVTTFITGFTPSIVSASKEDSAKIKNVIFLIGDGMGSSYTTAYRYMKDNPDTPIMEKTEFDKYLVGSQMTYPEDEHENIHQLRQRRY